MKDFYSIIQDLLVIGEELAASIGEPRLAADAVLRGHVDRFHAMKNRFAGLNQEDEKECFSFLQELSDVVNAIDGNLGIRSPN